MPHEEQVQPLDIAPVHGQPAAMSLDKGAKPLIADIAPDRVPGVIADGRPGGTPEQQRHHRHVAARHRHAAQPHDDLGRDGRQDILQCHQQEDAEIAAPGDELSLIHI